MLKNWNLRSNVIKPSTSSAKSSPIVTSSSPLKYLIPSISLLNFPDTENSATATADIAPTVPVLSKSISPPLFDCDNVYEFEDSECRVIRSVQILTGRLEAWYLLTKQLHGFFSNLAVVETQVAKAYGRSIATTPSDDDQKSKGSSVIGSHLEYQGGILHICQAWQAHPVAAAKGHDTMSNYLENHAVPVLTNMKRELKGMIRSVKSDDRLKLSTLAKLRREGKRRFLRLAQQLAFFEQHPDHGHTKEDPWLVNAGVVQQMLKVYQQTNKMHETVLRLQKEVMISETQLVQAFKQLCQDIYKIREQTVLGIDHTYERINQAVEAINVDADWLAFMEVFKHDLIPENARFLHPDKLKYPNHAHPLLQPLFASRMERNSSILRRWHEYIYVLTPAGFLHEYRSSSSYPIKPDVTIFIPHYNVSTLSTNLHHNLIFQLQPQSLPWHTYSFSPSPSAASSSTISSFVSSRESRIKTKSKKTITLRAKSAPDMQHWLEHLTQLSHRNRPSVSYTAPPFLQPTNATNPDVFITSPTMTMVDRAQSSVEEVVSTTTASETTFSESKVNELANTHEQEMQQSKESGKEFSAGKNRAKKRAAEPSLGLTSSVADARLPSSFGKEEPSAFQLTGVRLPEDME